MGVDIKNNDTLKVRMDPLTLNLLEKARGYVDLNKSKFIRMSVREKAEAIIAEHDKTVFSAHDWHMFFDMIDHPPKPTTRMKKAAQKYKEIIAQK